MTEIKKTGRNDPCPCGSGKKYKHCCLKAQQDTAPADHLWHRIRRAVEPLPGDLIKFADARFGPDGLYEAWDEFTLWGDEPFHQGTPHLQVFMPWFFYDWLPDPEDTAVPPEALDGLTLAEAYLRRKGKYLDPLLVRYAEKSVEAAFSFHDVVSCQPGSGFVLRDILTGEQADVTERSASQRAGPGDILFGKVVRIDHLALLEGCTPVVFPPQAKIGIVELRNRIAAGGPRLTPSLLKEYGLEMLALYYEIADRLLQPQLPMLQNTDGDPLLFCRLVYDIDSPREAFDALKQLCFTMGEEDLLSQAEFDAAGELHKIEFPWQKRGNAKHKSWDNTVLGDIQIEGRKLTAEVNSENRAESFRSLVTELLPGKARYRTTVIESPEAMLARASEGDESPAARVRKKETEDLNALPEVQAQMAEMLRQHYRNWLHQELPALNGETPMQAVKSRDGREKVEALLVQIERDGQNMKPPLDQGIITELRSALGLLQRPLL